MAALEKSQSVKTSEDVPTAKEEGLLIPAVTASESVMRTEDDDQKEEAATPAGDESPAAQSAPEAPSETAVEAEEPTAALATDGRDMEEQFADELAEGFRSREQAADLVDQCSFF